MNTVLIKKIYKDREKEYTINRVEAYLIWHEIISDLPEKIIIEDGDSLCIYEKDWRDKRNKLRINEKVDTLSIEITYVIEFH
jgi:hypothetical protein